MLETEIKALREEIVMLREAITAMAKTIAKTPENKKPEKAEKVPEAKPAPAEPAPAPTPAPALPAAPAMVTRDDLQNLCMTIVRADRSKREAIQATISKFGAENLVAIKDTDFPALHAALEALK